MDSEKEGQGLSNFLLSILNFQFISYLRLRN